MHLEDGRVACITRRYQRIWPLRLRGTILKGSSPGERRFEILDESLKTIDHITFDFWEENERAEATTPWGRITASTQDGYFRNGRAGTIKISRDGHVVTILRGHLLRMDFDFPGRTVMPFKLRPGRFVMRFEGTTGSAGLSIEQGTSEGEGGRKSHGLAWKEVKALPKENRPNSVEVSSYSQTTVRISGILPVDEKDVVMSLIIADCLSTLDQENYGG